MVSQQSPNAATGALVVVGWSADEVEALEIFNQRYCYDL
jgi:hypothetical protein